jgi:hypothetical protein
MRDLGKKRWGDKGRYAVEATQIGGVGAILYFNGHPALYAAMTIPTVAAHVLSSRAGIRWLTTGLKAGPFAQATINANTWLAALLAEEGIETGRWEDPDDPNKAPRRVREMPSVLGQPPMPPPLSPRAPGERVEPPPPAAPSLYDRTIGRAGEAIAPSTRPTPYRDLVGRR